jgi:hypothetical protein
MGQEGNVRLVLALMRWMTTSQVVTVKWMSITLRLPVT